jgi:16S rRNA (guanine966-N2)-methyltransferase
MSKSKRRRAEPPTAATELRIIGGRFRGRKLRYAPLRRGDELVTRPMKHRLRESIFNLVGVEVAGRHAIDLFAGTGALGLEALSRGAVHATFIEKHVPTARVIEESVKSLDVEEQSTLLVTSAFLWATRALAQARGAGVGDDPARSSIPSALPPSFGAPWLVFCSPPYAFYADRRDDMLLLLAEVMEAAPGGSIIVVEADEQFDFTVLPVGEGGEWDVRTYPPAVVGVWRKS